MKVIRDNMMEKKKRMADIEATKKADADQLETNMRVALEKEQAREREIAERGRKIQQKMEAMGEVIRDNGEEMRLKQEKEYIKQCIEKDEQAQLHDINKKHQIKAKHIELTQALAQQVNEKRLREENDQRANKSYMHRWVEQTAESDRQRQVVESNRKQKMLANQQFLREQMGPSAANFNGVTVASLSGAAVTGSSPPRNRKKYELGGLMNPEEARMNRALLQEIARVKRGEQPTDKLAAAVQNPI